MPKRYTLKGSSLEAIRAKALQHYGPGARIVAAEKVTNPGIVGLFAANRFEATVEVSDKPAGQAAAEVPGAPAMTVKAAQHPRDPGSAHDLDGTAIAALLERADAEELHLHRARPSAGAAAAPVSTASPDFAGLLEQLGKELERTSAPTAPPPPALPPAVPPAPMVTLPPSSAAFAEVPELLAGDGDLVLLLGLGDDALDVALQMSQAAGGADVRTAGELTAFGHLHVDGRHSATAARAQAVLTGHTVVVAYGLGVAGDAPGQASRIALLAPDQVWVVADARMKAEDTAGWSGALRAGLAGESIAVDALAVIGAAQTGTPETVNELGLPVGWVDGRPAAAATLGKVH